MVYSRFMLTASLTAGVAVALAAPIPVTVRDALEQLKGAASAPPELSTVMPVVGRPIDTNPVSGKFNVVFDDDGAGIDVEDKHADVEDELEEMEVDLESDQCDGPFGSPGTDYLDSEPALEDNGSLGADSGIIEIDLSGNSQSLENTATEDADIIKTAIEDVGQSVGKDALDSVLGLNGPSEPSLSSTPLSISGVPDSPPPPSPTILMIEGSSSDTSDTKASSLTLQLPVLTLAKSGHDPSSLVDDMGASVPLPSQPIGMEDHDSRTDILQMTSTAAETIDSTSSFDTNQGPPSMISSESSMTSSSTTTSPSASVTQSSTSSGTSTSQTTSSASSSAQTTSTASTTAPPQTATSAPSTQVTHTETVTITQTAPSGTPSSSTQATASGVTSAGQTTSSAISTSTASPSTSPSSTPSATATKTGEKSAPSDDPSHNSGHARRRVRRQLLGKRRLVYGADLD
ncbi:hypothetical protein FB446DRAFT_794703 [Lentinula raphanica]|nr:hypothetical protein FB446DRAFT_794703 [Lentinula raphanica]